MTATSWQAHTRALLTGEPVLPAAATRVDRAMLHTVAYADIFDYPLTPAEIHRYLVGPAVPARLVEELLARSALLGGRLGQRAGYITLAGREDLVETRQRRAAVAAQRWPAALRYARIIASLPFVRMVAVTGALAMDNTDADSDIDYLVITTPGRLWLCRALIIALVRLAARRGDSVCPNYLLSERALALSDHSLYTAHELVQMVPLVGLQTYQRMRQLNDWADQLLPNAAGPPRCLAVNSGRLLRGAAELALRTPIGAGLERWEMQRKLRKLGGQAQGRAESTFAADWCKGHFDGHGQRTLQAYLERLRKLEEITP